MTTHRKSRYGENAELAHLVERRPSKSEAASSSLAFRSKTS